MNHTSLQSARKSHSAQAYVNIGLETQVLSASSEQLITLLFRGALTTIAKAKIYMQNSNISGQGSAISKAIEIVDSGLKASIDREAGGELATNLTATYEIIIRNLLQANLHSDVEKLELAERLLSEIGDAWQTAVGINHKEASSAL
ncbi:MAG: flagellar export chaperone FliS [Burkholderiaceae bacterium]|nr:MAG: flagellar export chaperone FliS [Burkholderiaceae bacterium]TAM01728.1 MAG: flagellar export chaperone FliS [Pusillimonas sp.]